MNDKRAVGADRFFEGAGRILDAPEDELGALARETDTAKISRASAVSGEIEMALLMA